MDCLYYKNLTKYNNKKLYLTSNTSSSSPSTIKNWTKHNPDFRGCRYYKRGDTAAEPFP